MLGLGIDAGGTFTDGVIFDMVTGTVVAKAKSLTTRHDLAEGIGRAVADMIGTGGARGWVPGDLSLVSLSTTLATNAIVEGKGGVAGLILIGYDPRLVERYISAGPYEMVGGRHDIDGEEVEPLDEGALVSVAQSFLGRVDAVAVSSYMAARNPDHEIRARKILGRVLGVPVVCGHELSGELDSIKRATTAVLNARLIPTIVELIKAVRSIMDAHSITAPLMIVKGDGSLMGERMAIERPVETILSGPAASMAGAVHLSGLQNAIVLDMGGTTTDLGIANGGRARVNPGGAVVGGHRTSVSAVDVRTSGLGGDSYVQVDSRQNLAVGPRRVVPIAYLASIHPGVRAEVARLGKLAAMGKLSGLVQPGDFFSMVRRPNVSVDLHPQEVSILSLLSEGPMSRYQLCDRLGYSYPSLLRTDALEERGYILRCGFTPTDALHVVGAISCWSTDAALAMASLLGERAGSTALELAENVKRAVEVRLAREVVACVISEGMGKEAHLCETCGHLVDKVVGADTGRGSLGFQVSLRLDRPLVGIGAPAAAYLPAAAAILGCELRLPEHADVANAVGAITGQVVETSETIVRLNVDGVYVAHGPAERVEFDSLETALKWAEGASTAEARRLAQSAGAAEPVVTCERRQSVGALSKEYDHKSIFIEARVLASAVGSPAT